MTEYKALVMNPQDNVATLLQETPANSEITLISKARNIGNIKNLEQVDAYHKIALENISKDQNIHKYGEIIGIVTEEIKIGEHVHTHNVRSIKV